MDRNSTFMRIARATAFAAASALAVGAMVPANAAENDPAKPQEQAQAPAAKEKLYCVVETITGSILPHKTCKTRAEWIRDQNFDPLAPRK